jgi:quinate dehydrogenase (quinone)
MRIGLWVQMIPQKLDAGPATNGGEAVNTLYEAWLAQDD